jgi:hypothetical protein
VAQFLALNPTSSTGSMSPSRLCPAPADTRVTVHESDGGDCFFRRGDLQPRSCRLILFSGERWMNGYSQIITSTVSRRNE